MIRFSTSLPLLALLSPALLAAQDARDFQLPPGATSQPDTRVQGPVDADGPVPVRPRAIETARPTPSPSPAPAPAIALPSPSAARPAPQATTPRTAAPAPRAAATAGTSAAAPPPEAAGSVSGPVAGPGTGSPSPTIGTLPQPAPSAVAPATTTAIAAPSAPAPAAPLPWLWIALGGVALAGGAAFLLLRRRSAEEHPPEIVMPVVPVAATAPDTASQSEALAIAVEAVRMDRSVLNATVGYRITLRNRTAQALSAVAVEADLVSASRDRSAEQQIATPGQPLTPVHHAERLAPGQSLRFEGQVRLPLSQANAIWQGRVGLLVPLLRVRATAAGAMPVATTLVIGRSEGQASRPQPFRLDEPPRSYSPLAQRVLDAAPARA